MPTDSDPALPARPRLDEGLVPTLDGHALRVRVDRGDRHFTTDDGEAVDPTRERDIVYVNPTSAEDEDGWWAGAALGSLGPGLFDLDDAPTPVATSTEVAGLLADLGERFRPAGPPEASPATWHRLLARATSPDPVDVPDGPDDPLGLGRLVWKADLEATEDPAAPFGAAVYEARLWTPGAAQPARLRYWLQEAAEGQPARSGWLSAPPRLEAATEPQRVDSEAPPDLFGPGD